MKVKELIEKLNKAPVDAEVWYESEGNLKGPMDFVWICKNGNIGLGCECSYLGDEDDCPDGAVLVNNVEYQWQTWDVDPDLCL